MLLSEPVQPSTFTDDLFTNKNREIRCKLGNNQSAIARTFLLCKNVLNSERGKSRAMFERIN